MAASSTTQGCTAGTPGAAAWLAPSPAPTKLLIRIPWRHRRWCRHSSAVLFGTLLFCSASGQAADCTLLPTAELPRLGGLRGAWLSDERFVLVDFKRPRLLVYGTDEGFERSVLGVVTSPDVAEDLKPWRNGLLLAESTREVRRLHYLDSDLRAVSVPWQVATKGEAVGTSEVARPSGVTSVFQIVVLDDRVFLQGRKTDSAVIVELATSAEPGHVASLHEVAGWAAVPGEARYWTMPSVRTLAVTSGEAAAAFALRFGRTVHVQQLSGRSRQLVAFPDVEDPLPVFPPGGWENLQEYHTVLEAASYPAGVYGIGESLFVLMKSMVNDEPVWDLHRIDPVADTVVGRTRLPTRATFVSLLPGPKYWVLEESSSHFADLFRKPLRLLLLESAAVRSGEPLSCD